MASHILALDQGTTSSRTIVFDAQGRAVAQASAPLPCQYPHPGWVEQHPEEIWQSQLRTVREALAKAGIGPADVAALGITNQRETTIAWHRGTGQALGPAIVWQDRRTAALCDQLKAEGLEPHVRDCTGLVIDPYFSATKMHWILAHVDGAAELAAAGDLAFGTVDSWLIWQLTAGQAHLTDATNAARTMLHDIHRGEWDSTLCERLGIPLRTLPTVCDSSGVVAHTSPHVFGAAVPIAGVAGDQHAALFGQACFEPGMAKNTYGTGCFMLTNTGETPVASQHGLLTTPAWRIGGRTTYALEGAVFIGGAVVQWLRDGLELFDDAGQTEAMARAVEDNGGVYLVPAFVGLGAPHWDPYARGLLIGLTRDTGRNHVVRAALEAIAYQSLDVLRCMEEDTGHTLSTLCVDGGASANDFLCQFQADLLGRTVSRPDMLETTALGAAYLAGLAVGTWRDTAQLQELWAEERAFAPQRPAAEVEALVSQWRRAVERAKGWAQ